MKLCLAVALAGLLLISGGSYLLGPPYCAGVPAGSTARFHLGTINAAEETFRSSEKRYGTVEELVAAGLLDAKFRTTVADYNFEVIVNGSEFRVTAEPRTPKVGFNLYCGPDGVVRYGSMAPADLAGTAAF